MAPTLRRSGFGNKSANLACQQGDWRDPKLGMSPCCGSLFAKSDVSFSDRMGHGV